MTAQQARELTNKAEFENAQRFWDELKDKLFKEIERTALGRGSQVLITKRDELNLHGWITYLPLVSKVKLELETLGYEVTHCDEPKDSMFFGIRW